MIKYLCFIANLSARIRRFIKNFPFFTSNALAFDLISSWTTNTFLKWIWPNSIILANTYTNFRFRIILCTFWTFSTNLIEHPKGSSYTSTSKTIILLIIIMIAWTVFVKLIISCNYLRKRNAYEEKQAHNIYFIHRFFNYKLLVADYIKL